MKHLTDILIENGYKPMTWTRDGYVEKKEHYMDFSTMRSGGIATYWVNGESVIIWGLNEYGKPPTLIPSHHIPQDFVMRTLDNVDHQLIFEHLVKKDYSIFYENSSN